MSVEQEAALRTTLVACPPTVDEGDVMDPAEIRRVLSHFATGITVVTAGGATPHGLTANAFASVSLDPPLILVCVNRTGQLHDSVVAAEAFAVSVLAAPQMELARHFADSTRPDGLDQFDGGRWYPGPRTGAPVSRDALVHLECALWRVYEGGDHWIILGRVLSTRCTPGAALLYFGGDYRELALEL